MLPQNKVMDNKIQYTVEFFALIFTLFLLGTLGSVLLFSIEDVLNIEYILQTFNLPTVVFVPEKSEKITYFSLVFLLPCVYFGFYLLYSFLAKKHFIANIFLKLFVIIQITEMFVVVTLYIFLTTLNNYWLIHTETSFFYYLIYLLIFSLGVLVAQIYGTKYKRTVSVFAVGFTLILFCAYVGTYVTSMYSQNLTTMHHFDAYYYPIYKVISAGMTIGKDFNSLYGLYPYFYELFFKIANLQISILNVSLVNTFLVLISYFAMAYCAWKYITNKGLYLITICVLVYFVTTIGLGEYYLQFNPHRMIFISMLIGLCSWYLNIQNVMLKKILWSLGYIISILSILWNVETGLIVLFAWAVFLSYLEIYKKTKLYKILLIWFWAGIALIFAGEIIYTIPYFRTGNFLPIDNFFLAQKYFYENGAFMIKMSLFKQPWMLLILIYVLALTKSLNGLFDKKLSGSPSCPILFLLSVIGFGIFVWYQGRSHTCSLPAVAFPAIIIGGIFMQEYLNTFLCSLKKNKQISSVLSLIFGLKFLILFIIFSIFAGGVIKYLCFVPETYTFKNNVVKRFVLDMDFINSSVPKGEKVDVIADFADIYYTERQEKDTLPFAGISDLFTKYDYKLVLEYLGKTNNPVILGKRVYSSFMYYEPQEFAKVMERFKQVRKNDDLLLFKVVNAASGSNSKREESRKN